MSTSLTLATSLRPDGTSLLRAVGEIDRSNSDEFAAAVEKAVKPADGRLTIDLTEVGYLDSAGLTVLFAHAREITVVVSQLLVPVVEISGLSELTEIASPIRCTWSEPGDGAGLSAPGCRRRPECAGSRRRPRGLAVVRGPSGNRR